MSDPYKKVFYVKPISAFFRRFLLLLVETVIRPTLSTLDTPYYPDWNMLLIFYLIGGFVLLMWVVYSIWQTTDIQFIEDTICCIKKSGQKEIRHPFSALLAHKERPSASKMVLFMELPIYMTDNWFVIRYHKFSDYSFLKKSFTQYGQAVPLSSGDKYVRYTEIPVFGLDQDNSVRMITPNSTVIQEPTHTNPL